MLAIAALGGVGEVDRVRAAAASFTSAPVRHCRALAPASASRTIFTKIDMRSARDAAGLAGLRVYDLRHAHASWLLAGGADLQVVKERLGHASIVTAEKYRH
jgi:integrase